jgi:hypothetical protein
MSLLEPRRDALKKIAAAASAMALTSLDACATGGAMSTAAAPRPAGKWDMSWTERVKKKPRRIAFDTNEIQGGASLSFVQSYLMGAAEAYGSNDDDAVVLVLRHASVPIALGDDLWARLSWGETQKLKDPTTGETAKRNPFINYKSGDRFSMVSADSTLEALISRGVTVLACNMAFTGVVGMLANREKISRDEARKQALASLVPGVTLMPNGVFAVGAAQNAGCGCITVR